MFDFMLPLDDDFILPLFFMRRSLRVPLRSDMVLLRSDMVPLLIVPLFMVPLLIVPVWGVVVLGILVVVPGCGVVLGVVWAEAAVAIHAKAAAKNRVAFMGKGI